MSNGDPIFEEQLTPRLEAPIAGRLAPTPYNFELTASEALRLTVHNSQAGVVVSVHVRVLHPKQGIVANVYSYVPSTDRTADWDDWFIGDGYVLNVTAFASAGTPRRGQTFIRLQIIRGTGQARTVLGTLLQGYITENQDLAWPGSPLEGSLEGDGYYRALTGTDPAAGVELLETVPTGARWEILFFYYQYAASAVAATRRLSIVIDDGTVPIFHALHPLTLTAGQQGEFTWTHGATFEATPPQVVGVGFLPVRSILLAGQRVRSVTYNMQAGDNYLQPVFTIREWLEAQ